MPDITLLYGNDEYAISRRLKELDSGFTDPTSAEMNTARLEARSVSDNDLNNALNAMPFLAPRRLVILSQPSARYVNPPVRKKFEELVLAIPDTTRLVLVEIQDMKPRDFENHWLVKWAAKNGIKAQACMLPQPREMPGWMVNEAKRQEGMLEPAAAAKLTELVGTETRQASMEIAKLLAYVNWSRPITAGDVEAVSLGSAGPDVFSLVDAMALSNTGLAQKSLHHLLESQDVFTLWGMVIRQFRLLLLAREVIDAHGMIPDVQETLKVHSYVAEKIYAQAKRFPLPALEAIYHRLLVMDEAAKTGQMPLETALDILVTEMAPG